MYNSNAATNPLAATGPPVGGFHVGVINTAHVPFSGVGGLDVGRGVQFAGIEDLKAIEERERWDQKSEMGLTQEDLAPPSQKSGQSIAGRWQEEHGRSMTGSSEVSNTRVSCGN